MPKPFLFLLTLFLSSCATIFNSKVHKVRIDAAPGIEVVGVDSIFQKRGEHAYYTYRKKEPLVMHVKMDGELKTVQLRSRNSFAWWTNIYFNYGIGMLVERNQPKRYTYRRNIYLERLDTSVRVRSFAPARPHRVNLVISLPEASHFNVLSDSGRSVTGGFMGIALGLEYHYTGRRYFSLSAGMATDFPIPFPAPFDYRGTWVSNNVSYINLRNNRTIGRFHLGYGLHGSELKWRKSFYYDSVPGFPDSVVHHPTLTRKGFGLGPCLSLQFRMDRHFFIGIFYQPSLLNLSYGPALSYQHFVSFELAWKLKVYDREKRRTYEGAAF